MPTLARSLRRLRLNRHRRLVARAGGDLAWLGPDHVRRRTTCLLDTTVYVDVLRVRTGPLLEAALQACDLWHGAVGIGELARGLGAADPDRPAYAADQRTVLSLVEAVPEHKLLTPDAETFELAGIAAGVLKRVLGLDRDALARLSNDALLFFTGRKHGLPILTSNRRDFDLLQQIEPRGELLLYPG